MLFKDVRQSDPPLTYQLHGITGSIHRILIVDQHLALLSSNALFIWLNFVATAFEGKSTFNKPTFVLPMEAVEINAWGRNRLLVVMASNSVNLIDFDELYVRSDFPESHPRFWNTSDVMSENIFGEIRPLDTSPNKMTNDVLTVVS